MIAQRTDSSLFTRQPDADLSVQEQRINKLQRYVATLARIAELVDFAAIAVSVDNACPGQIAAVAGARRTRARSWYA
ncbi:hypothetical protein ACQUJT_24275 [Ralstonia pseudosolanacearum]|uniref:hypothetical protein n=1 Tax=Ralstonia solanacearum species complex bacterium KE056 TaxID=3119585 RepID=UPI002FC3912B